jgi:hypothetical protein
LIYGNFDTNALTINGTLTTTGGITLDDGVGDSPILTLQDADNKVLTFQKMDAGEANIINDEGQINIKPSGDTDDYLVFSTAADVVQVGVDDDTNLMTLVANTLTVNGTLIGTGPLWLANSADPGAKAGHAGIYALTDDLFAIDAGGNSTQLSPHDSETGNWIFYSKNLKTGRVLKIEMEELMFDLAKELSQKTGKVYIKEYMEF